MYKKSLARLRRSYPSLNLMLNVSKDKHQVDVVLPGLRFDDYDHTGQPNISKMFDMMSHVEITSMRHAVSFLDYETLRKQNMMSYVKACQLDIRSDFYETTTPKAPLEVRVHLGHIGESTFTTVVSMFCPGKVRPSMRIMNMHTLVHRDLLSPEPVPDWWKRRFRPLIAQTNSSQLFVKDEQKPKITHQYEIAVPLSDTDLTERTRCASYLRYFIDNSSIASKKLFYHNIRTSFHDFHIKKMTMLYYGPSFWGDNLMSETWEDKNPLQVHCLVSKGDLPLWYAKMDLYEEVFGLPNVEGPQDQQ